MEVWMHKWSPVEIAMDWAVVTTSVAMGMTIALPALAPLRYTKNVRAEVVTTSARTVTLVMVPARGATQLASL